MKSLVVAATLTLAAAHPAWALGERPFVTFEAGKDAVVLAREPIADVDDDGAGLRGGLRLGGRVATDSIPSSVE